MVYVRVYIVHGLAEILGHVTCPSISVCHSTCRVNEPILSYDTQDIMLNNQQQQPAKQGMSSTCKLQYTGETKPSQHLSK